MARRKYDILFWILVGCLLFHFLFVPIGLFKDLPLNGYFKLPQEVEFNAENYFSRRYQDSTDLRFKYGMGMFPAFTRIHHQLEYSLFDRIHVKDVHIGKEGYLFRYCKSCITENDFDPARLDGYIRKYKRFSDSLRKEGREVLWIIAPEKNIVYSEYLPDEARTEHVYKYYWTLQNAFRENGIVFMDFNRIARQKRDRLPFRVYNKGGVHWTSAFAAYCYDSVCSYLSNRDIRINDLFTFREVEHPWEPDIDMEAAANLLRPLQTDDHYLADMKITSARDKRLLLIGDSFSYSWLWTRWCEQSFHPGSEFWYYNKEVNTLGNVFERSVIDSETRNRAASFDVYIFLFSAGNAENLDYGFLDAYYR